MSTYWLVPAKDAARVRTVRRCLHIVELTCFGLAILGAGAGVVSALDEETLRAISAALPEATPVSIRRFLTEEVPRLTGALPALLPARCSGAPFPSWMSTIGWLLIASLPAMLGSLVRDFRRAPVFHDRQALAQWLASWHERR